MNSPIKIPKGKTLYPFQITAIGQMLDFLKETSSVYNACEMGLGKSVQTLVTLNNLKCRKILIICPAVMRATWEKECADWLTTTTEVSVIEKLKDKVNLRSDVAILSYEGAVALKDSISLAGPWDAVVFDEAHALKNPKAKRTKACLTHIFPLAKYRLFLSGTPFLSCITDVYPVFSKILPLTFPDFYSFALTYAYKKVTHFGIKWYGLKNHSQLANIIKQKFFIRYNKESVLKDLPDKVYKKVVLPSSYTLEGFSEELKEYQQAVFDSLEYQKGIPQHLSRVRILQGICKIEPIVSYVEELLEQNIPVLLFACHTEVIHRYKEQLLKYKPVVIQGSTTPAERARAIQVFQTGESNLFIGQYQAAGVGITLTRSSNVVLAELDWSPSIIDQGISRCHRITQKETVTVHYFIVKDSVDENISDIIIEKSKNFKKVLDSAECAV